ncbi:MAG: hypothetical protein D6806_05515 [Deltaproteobacteria bacterium]|nr:MAG: hypothetical protein D6806_05515 [Deltaproteobacteria bacterium]
MKTFVALLIAAFVLPAVGCQYHRKATRADRPATVADNREKKKKKDMDEIVCKIVQVTGSRIKRRVCKSRFMWEMERQDAQYFLKRPRGSYQLR